MTITDWQFMLRCFPPHLTVTQLRRISGQSTFDLDCTFTFCFITITGALGPRLRGKNQKNKRTLKIARNRLRPAERYFAESRAGVLPD